MKLECKVRVIDRKNVSNGFSAKTKSSRGVIGLSKSDEWVFIIRLYKDNVVKRYKIRDNVQTVLNRCVNDGLCTIQFKDPPHDIQLSEANVESLKTFLSGIRVTSNGLDLPSTVKSTTVDQVVKIQRPTTQMEISNAKEFPQLKGFPSTLEKLIINNSSLRTPVDHRIFTLKHLHYLDLSHNTITELPERIHFDHLHTFICTNNQLNCFHEMICPKLRYLDLSHNFLDKIYLTILKLTSLEKLNLSNNQISYIPKQLQRCLSNLQTLNISHNQIRSIPNSFSSRNRKLHTLNYSGNPLMKDKCVLYKNFNITLVELALRTIIKNR